jgi:N-acetylneuraminic acid mutarotase
MPDGVVTIGGTYWTASNAGAPVKHWIPDVYWLRSGAGAWERLPDYPLEVAQLLALAVGDKLYAIGGRNAHRPLRETHYLSLDSASAGWQRGPDLPRPLYALAGGSHNGVIYVVTDAVATQELNDGVAQPPQILVLDTNQNDPQWRELDTVPNADLGYHSIAIAGDSLFLFGGAVQDGEILKLCDDVQAFDLGKRQWSPRRPLPQPLRDASAVALNDRYLLITGGVEDAADAVKTPDGEPRILLCNACLLYDVEADEFTYAPPLRMAVADHGVAVLDGKVLVIAGEDSPYRTRTDLVQAISVRRVTQVATLGNQPAVVDDRGRANTNTQ